MHALLLFSRERDRFSIFGANQSTFLDLHKVGKNSPNYFVYTLRRVVTVLFFLTLWVPQLKANLLDTTPLPCPKGSKLLFYLQRDPDANTVIYELNFRKDGSLHPENPVVGSWIRYSEQGQHKELSCIEKKFAYGVQSKALGKEEYEIRLAAHKKLPLYLKRSVNNKKYYVYVMIENKQMLLKRVFVRVNGGSFWFPKVQYIDLFLIDSLSGKEITHRIQI